MATHTISAMFDNRAEAERAIEALVSEVGLHRSSVRMDDGAGAAGTLQPEQEKGFFASLKELFVPEEDSHTYAEGLRRGSMLVSAQLDEAQMDRAMDVLEQHGAVDLNERETEWRSGGWTGRGATAATVAGTGVAVSAVSDGSRTGLAAMPSTSASDGSTGNPTGTMLSRGVDQVAGTNVSGAHPENEQSAAVTGTAASRTTAGSSQGEEAIPIVEEQLRVGKQEVNRGRVRVRSYVVETPVQEQVTLHQEHVDIERHTVDRPVTATDQLFQERTIEAAESVEEAIVAKEARVKEEVVIRKEAEERVQTVQDTVRRTEVEVDDRRTGAASSGTTTGKTRTPDPSRA